MGAPLAIGTVAGHRGITGEVTVRVGSGLAERWLALRTVTVEGGSGSAREMHVESARAYRDRLVLKLRGIDDAGQAEALRGARLLAPPDQIPALPEGTYWVADLIGMTALDETGAELGRVHDVVEAGGGHLLRIYPEGGVEEELLVPMVREIVVAVDARARCLRLRLPEGLADLNRTDG